MTTDIAERLEIRAANLAKLEAAKANVACLQKSLHAALWGGQAYRSGRSQRNPFDRNLARPRTQRLIVLVGKAQEDLRLLTEHQP